MPIESGGRKAVYFCGGWYCDKLLRTDQGWKFTERVEEYSFNTAEMEPFRY